MALPPSLILVKSVAAPGKRSPPPGNCFESRIYVLFLYSVRTDRHADCDAAADVRSHHQVESAALDCLHDLPIESIDSELNFRIALALRLGIRHKPEVQRIKSCLIKHLEIRMFADE